MDGTLRFMHEQIHIGDVVFTPDTQLLCHQGEQVVMEEKPAMCLALLMQNPNALVSKDTFFNTVWQDVVVSDASISRCISQLRTYLKKVGAIESGFSSSNCSAAKPTSSCNSRLPASAGVSPGSIKPFGKPN